MKESFEIATRIAHQNGALRGTPTRTAQRMPGSQRRGDGETDSGPEDDVGRIPIDRTAEGRSTWLDGYKTPILDRIVLLPRTGSLA